jgi:hypothetical protein
MIDYMYTTSIGETCTVKLHSYSCAHSLIGVLVDAYTVASASTVVAATATVEVCRMD